MKELKEVKEENPILTRGGTSGSEGGQGRAGPFHFGSNFLVFDKDVFASFPQDLIIRTILTHRISFSGVDDLEK